MPVRYSYSTANLEALEAAVATGARRVMLDGQDVTFYSAADMRSLLAYMRRALDSAPRPDVILSQYNRGV